MDTRFQNLERKIGLFVLSVLVAIVVLMIAIGIKKDLLSATTDIISVTNSAQGITEGMAVKLSGFKIGKIKAVELDDIAQVKVTMAIYKKYMKWIKADARARLSKEGFIGDSIIEIVGSSAKSPPASNDIILPFDREKGINEILEEVRDELQPVLIELIQIMKYINDPTGDVKQTVANVRMLTKELMLTVKEANQLLDNTDKSISHTTKKINSLIDNITLSTISITKTIQKVDEDLPGVLTDVKTTLDNIKKITDDLRQTVQKTAPGIPTLMQKGQDIADDTKDITGSVKKMWPVKNFIKQPDSTHFPIDSYE